jgi:hypothetical protein
MSCFTRVHKLNQIPVLDERGCQIDVVQVSGRMTLPMSIERPVDGGAQPPLRYFLSLGLGQLAYLHEQVPVT